jgi:methylphosphotriester-DNA--protein-cysteine methyltransferase
VVVSSFNAVVTTGTHCLPGWGDRPRPEHVREHPLTAAAAVAGFRACGACLAGTWA